MSSSTLFTRAEQQVRYIEDRCTAYAETHASQYRRWARWRDVLGFPVAILSAITGATAFSSIPNNAVIAGMLAVAVAILSAASSYLKPGEKVEQNRLAELKYRKLRHDVSFFWKFDASSNDEQSIILWLKNTTQEYVDISKDVPPIQFNYVAQSVSGSASVKFYPPKDETVKK